MKFRIKIANAETPDITRWEEYDKSDVSDPWEWGREIIEYYNSTLQGAHDKPRVFLDAEILDDDTNPDHDWGKTNLVTQMIQGKPTDLFKCCGCGITGKRVRLGTSVQRHSKYRAKVYERCDTAQAHLAKRALSGYVTPSGAKK